MKRRTEKKRASRWRKLFRKIAKLERGRHGYAMLIAICKRKSEEYAARRRERFNPTFTPDGWVIVERRAT